MKHVIDDIVTCRWCGEKTNIGSTGGNVTKFNEEGRLIAKYFKPTNYTACVTRGLFAGMVGEVVYVSNQFFSVTKAGLAWIQLEKYGRVCVAVEHLERV